MRFILVNDAEKRGYLFFFRPIALGPQYLPSALGEPISVLPPNFLSLLFFIMSVADSIFHKQQCCGGVRKCKTFSELEGYDRPCNLTKNELHHALFIENV